MIYRYLFLVIVFLIFVSCSDENLPYQESYLCSYDLDSNNNDYIISESGGIAKFNFDASRVIVSTNYGFWSIQTDGTNTLTFTDSLTAKLGTFHTSPINDDWIFVDNSEVYKMDLYNNIVCLTEELDEAVTHTSYSLDGSKIIFSTKTDTLESYVNKIYLMDSDGSNLTLIYESDVENEWIRYPIISENMEIVFFMKNVSGLYMLNTNDANLDIIDADASLFTAISTGSDFLIYSSRSQEIIAYNFLDNSFLDITSGENPSISPDGSRITYYKNSDLFIYYIDEDEEDKLVESSDNYQFFSHNGDKIVFWGQKGNRTRNITSLELKKGDFCAK